MFSFIASLFTVAAASGAVMGGGLIGWSWAKKLLGL
jgi:hypothetical protein